MNKFKYILFTLIVHGMTACYYTEKADILVHNAKIYTMDSQFSIAEAMAIKDGKIIETGPNNELKNRYQAKEEIDAKLRPIYPGFIDAHCHFLWYGNTFFEVDLTGTKSWSEVIEKTKVFAENNQDEWIIGSGWDQNKWTDNEFPTKAKLDSLFPDRAVILKRIDQHAAIANQKALNIAGITTASQAEGGIFKVKNGSLTGLLIDNAINMVVKSIPEPNPEQMERSLLKAQEMCFSMGLTTVDDAMMENQTTHLIDQLQQSGKLKMRIYGMLTPSDENKQEYLRNGPYVTDRLSLRSFKYFADGALGSRGAKLIEPYHDDVKNKGLLLKDSTYFHSEAKELYKNGFQMNTHCIGDAANRMILNIYGDILEGTNDKRWRIEHAQVVSSEDIDKFKKYTIIPSIQPTHATSDMLWVEDRLGSERLKSAYAWSDLLRQNGLVALGTDFPIEEVNPIKTFFAAVFRKDKNGLPKNGFQMENSLSRKDALKGMTIWAAISNFEEDQKGSLEKGKVADFVILDQDLMQVDEEKVLKTEVKATYVNGEKVYPKVKK